MMHGDKGAANNGVNYWYSNASSIFNEVLPSKLKVLSKELTFWQLKSWQRVKQAVCLFR